MKTNERLELCMRVRKSTTQHSLTFWDLNRSSLTSLAFAVASEYARVKGAGVLLEIATASSKIGAGTW